MRIVWAGLWSRRGAAGATLLLAVMAIAFAMIGPMYARSAGEHLLDSRIAEREPTATVLTAERPAMLESDLPKGSPSNYHPPAAESLAQEAAASMDDEGVADYWRPPTKWLLDAGGTIRVGGIEPEMPLYWHEDMCSLAAVSGTCPDRAGEAVIESALAETLDLEVGDSIDVDFTEQWLVGRANKSRRTQRSFTIIGTYTAPSSTDTRWGDPFRLIGDPTLYGPPGVAATPRAPALLVAPDSMTSQTVTGGADRVIDLDEVNLDTMHAAARSGNRAAVDHAEAQAQGATPYFDLDSTVEDADNEYSTLSRITVAAVAPLVVLGLLLLHGLIAASADTRRQQVALAKLRGLPARRVLWFALAEPVAVILVAVPIAVPAAWGATRLITDSWLAADTPVAFGAPAWIAATLVVVAALVAAFIAVARVQREPLSASLGASGHSTRVSRWALVGRSAVIALAVAVTVQIAVDSSDDGGVLGLVAPVLISLAVAVAAGWALLQVTRVWIGRTVSRGGTAGFLAARRLGRRRDLASMVIPLVLATAVAGFAASAWVVGDDWKVSQAAAQVGAARSYSASGSAQHLLAVTHRADPEGDYLAAVVVRTRGDGTARQLLVDTSRLDSVVSWDPTWSDTDVADLQRRLAPQGSTEPLTFTGNRLEIEITRSRLDDAGGLPPELAVDYLDDDGKPATTRLGPIHKGTVTGELRHCDRSCTLQEVKVTGSGGSSTTAQGDFTIGRVSVDGTPADWHLDAAEDWRAARPYAATPADPPVTIDQDGDGLKVSVYLSHLPPGGSGKAPVSTSAVAGITPNDVPDVLPALLTTGTPAIGMPAPQSGIGATYDSDVFAAKALNEESTPFRLVAEVEALPGIGTEGVLVDLGASLRQPADPSVDLDTRLWVADGTPQEVLDQVRDAGISLSAEQRESDELETLRTDAFNLGWRIFLLVGGLTLLLALVGVHAGAVSQRRWRTFETTSLLAVLVPRRILRRAAVVEHTAVVALVTLFGLAAAWVSLRVVLPAVDLGETSATAPSPDYAIRWPVLLAIGLVVFLMATVTTSVISLRTIRTADVGDLPWQEHQT